MTSSQRQPTTLLEDKLAEKVKNVGECWQTKYALKSSQEPVLAFGFTEPSKVLLTLS